MRITYIGHATLLLELAGQRLLTDPNFDPALAAVLPRVQPPGLALAELPPLDAILLTHAHADHLSFRTLDALVDAAPVYAPPVYAPPAVAKWLVRLGYRHALPVAPGDRVRIGPVDLHAAPAAHRGSRYAVDRWRAATNMYLLDSGAESAFFAGDTALTPESHALVAATLGASGRRLDVALLPIGHAPWWKPGFRRGHLTSADALELFARLGARAFVPYHWGTFHHVTSRAFDAIDRLRVLLEGHALREGVKILEPGETLECSPPQP